jgi:hypothetical protein
VAEPERCGGGVRDWRGSRQQVKSRARAWLVSRYTSFSCSRGRLAKVLSVAMRGLTCCVVILLDITFNVLWLFGRFVA